MLGDLPILVLGIIIGQETAGALPRLWPHVQRVIRSVAQAATGCRDDIPPG
jgi:hypothetical protein